MPGKQPRELMAALMAGGVPERIPYSVGLMPEAFWERMDCETGRPLAEAYPIDLGIRRVELRGRGKPPRAESCPLRR